MSLRKTTLVSYLMDFSSIFSMLTAKCPFYYLESNGAMLHPNLLNDRMPMSLVNPD